MTTASPTKTIASALALGAFAVAVIAGLAVGNPADVILSRALLSMLCCYAVGAAVATMAVRAVEEAGERLVAEISEDDDAEAAPPTARQTSNEARATERAAAA